MKKKTLEASGKTQMKTMQDYIDLINSKKWDAHNKAWLYIELESGSLMDEVEPGVKNIKTVCDAMKDVMLEGDAFIVETKRASGKMAVRYYCDNLESWRRKYTDVVCA